MVSGVPKFAAVALLWSDLMLKLGSQGLVLCICQLEFLPRCSWRHHLCSDFVPSSGVQSIHGEPKLISAGPSLLDWLGRGMIVRDWSSNLFVFDNGGICLQPRWLAVYVTLFLFATGVCSCLLCHFRGFQEKQSGGLNGLQLWVSCKACQESVLRRFRGGGCYRGKHCLGYLPLDTHCKAVAFHCLKIMVAVSVGILWMSLYADIACFTSCRCWFCWGIRGFCV